MKNVMLILLLSSAPAFACGPDDCGPPPKPEPPKIETPDKPEAPKSSDNDPMPAFDQPEWMPCCVKDGTTIVHVEGWLRLLHGKTKATQITSAHCAKQAVLPECKAWEPKQ